MKRQLSSRPNLDQLKHQARDLLNAHRAGDEEALRRNPGESPRSRGWLRRTCAQRDSR